MVRVTADTNIYVSALNFGGMPELLLRLAEAGAIRLLISDAILSEIATVLRGDKFAWPAQEIEKALRQIARLTEKVYPTQRLDIITQILQTIEFLNVQKRAAQTTLSVGINTCCE